MAKHTQTEKERGQGPPKSNILEADQNLRNYSDFEPELVWALFNMPPCQTTVTE